MPHTYQAHSRPLHRSIFSCRRRFDIRAEAASPLSYAGFDVLAFPGLRAMRIWKEKSPYRFCGYYLTGPCRPTSPWSGQRARLVEIGWNLLPIYVGQQPAGASRCNKNTLTRAQGEHDARDAIRKMTNEGFPAGTMVYLDVERTEAVSAELSDYVQAWMAEVWRSKFFAGLYCHVRNADDLRPAAEAATPPDAPVPPRYWLVGGPARRFRIGKACAADCGKPFANIWQRIEVARKWGGVELTIDENIADWPDPAGPIS